MYVCVFVTELYVGTPQSAITRLYKESEQLGLNLTSGSLAQNLKFYSALYLYLFV